MWIATIILASGLSVTTPLGSFASSAGDCAAQILDRFDDLGWETPRSIECYEAEEIHPRAAPPEPSPDEVSPEPPNWEDQLDRLKIELDKRTSPI